MRFVKFEMSNGEKISLPFDKAEAVLNSTSQLVQITGEDGKWSGKTINKAHIVITDRDKDKERDWSLDHTKALPEPEKVPRDISMFKPNFIQKPYSENE